MSNHFKQKEFCINSIKSIYTENKTRLRINVNLTSDAVFHKKFITAQLVNKLPALPTDPSTCSQNLTKSFNKLSSVLNKTSNFWNINFNIIYAYVSQVVSSLQVSQLELCIFNI